MTKTVAERAQEVRKIFRSKGDDRDEFLATFSDKIYDMFWFQMKEVGGNCVCTPVCAPEMWHSLATDVVLDQIREMIKLAEVGPMDEESLMGITQVTLNAIVGKEVRQLDRKWVGLEFRDEVDIEDGGAPDEV